MYRFHKTEHCVDVAFSLFEWLNIKELFSVEGVILFAEK